MIAGNALTTIIGAVAAVMMGSGVLLLLGIGVAWALAVLPARRLITAATRPWLRHFSPGALAGLMALALALSCVLFSVAQMGAFADQLWLYWAVKLTAIYLALVVSIILTAFSEEWVIWRLASYPEQHNAFVKPVIRANLLVLLAVMILRGGGDATQSAQVADVPCETDDSRTVWFSTRATRSRLTSVGEPCPGIPRRLTVPDLPSIILVAAGVGERPRQRCHYEIAHFRLLRRPRSGDIQQAHPILHDTFA